MRDELTAGAQEMAIEFTQVVGAEVVQLESVPIEVTNALVHVYNANVLQTRSGHNPSVSDCWGIPLGKDKTYTFTALELRRMKFICSEEGKTATLFFQCNQSQSNA
jgi:hypothetical protein